MMTTFPKVIYEFKAIPTPNPSMLFFVEIDNLVLKAYRHGKDPEYPKNHSDFKTYYEATLIKACRISTRVGVQVDGTASGVQK